MRESARRPVHVGAGLARVVTDVMVLPETRTSSTDGNGDLIAHIADKADIARCYVTGEELVALCGVRWVPCRDPDGLPVCAECLTILGTLGGKAASARLRELNGR